VSLILVTGASGFLGKALVRALVEEGRDVRATFRNGPQESIPGAEAAIVGSGGALTDWSAALQGVSAVVHLAGPAHASDAEPYLRREITQQTARLAEQAEQSGVARFIFISSIKAAAARSRQPLREVDTPAPEDGYGRAKLEAERAVLARTQLRPLALRPPLVCAPDAKGNFARLLQLADTPWPLPFKSLTARRSLISRDSFVRAIQSILAKPEGPAGIFHLADAPPLSAGEMVAALRHGMGRSANQFSLPGVEAIAPPAFRESLVVDDSAFRAAYGHDVDVSASDMLRTIGAAWKAA